MGLLDDLRKAPVVNEGSEGGGSFAQSWRWAAEGDGIEGVVVHVDSRVHDNHPDGYPIVTVRDADGVDWGIHGMTTVLKGELQRVAPVVGDTLACLYDGKKQTAAGRSFHAFRVAVSRGDGSVPVNKSVQEAVVDTPPF